jgi:hypothetical protein
MKMEGVMEKKKLILYNLTPHHIVILAEDPQGKLVGTTGNGPSAEYRRYRIVAKIPPSDSAARVVKENKELGSLQIKGTKIRIFRRSYRDIINLPEPKEGVFYFVSAFTAHVAAQKGRPTHDLLFASELVKNRKGKIIGITSFSQL